uniref:Ring finger protein 115 n=1 Tax=Calidris pygmaea TaxID=425635 RepID=A0A8C3JQ41_9CHAR
MASWVAKTSFFLSPQEYTCPRCESGFIEEVTDDSRYRSHGGITCFTTRSRFFWLWDHLDHTMFFPDFRPFLSSSSLDQDSRDNERGHQAHADLWGPSRPPRLPMTRRYRSRGSSRPDRSPQIFAGFFANSAIPGSQHPFSWSGMLHSNPGDYAWGQSGLDAIVTQLLGQLENTGPPPADKEKISSLPTVTVTQEQVGSQEAAEFPCCHARSRPLALPEPGKRSQELGGPVAETSSFAFWAGHEGNQAFFPSLVVDGTAGGGCAMEISPPGLPNPPPFWARGLMVGLKSGLSFGGTQNTPSLVYFSRRQGREEFLWDQGAEHPCPAPGGL